MGFAAGVNQGLARAQGQYLVLLNNDTVVTPNWLRDLISWSLVDWPNVGLVGPMTNYTAAPQVIEPGYGDISDLDAFAQQHRRQFAGKAQEIQRLTGFCLLIRRAVLEKIGGRLDERYGTLELLGKKASEFIRATYSPERESGDIVRIWQGILNHRRVDHLVAC